MIMMLFLVLLISIISIINSYSISNSRCSSSISIRTYKSTISNSRYFRINKNINTLIKLYNTNDDNNNSNEVEDDDNDNNNNDNNTEANDDNVEIFATNTTTVEAAAVLSPEEQAIVDKEKELKSQLDNMENQLRRARLDLTRVRDKISESGKNGYFIQQAQVAEFLKKKDVEQKERVQRNKREFVMKMLPVVGLFREAPIKAVANNEREEQMHENFGSLLTSILTVFEKYGYKEFQAELGTKYDPSKHQVNEMVLDTPNNDGMVVTVISSGWTSDDGDVIKRSIVNVGKADSTKAADSTNAADSTEADSTMDNEKDNEADSTTETKKTKTKKTK